MRGISFNMEIKCEAIVIGGGISGLATAKSFKEAGLEVKLLERTDGIGGLWNYRTDEYGVMDCTYINVSKENYCFSDFPFPDNTPHFPHHSVMYEYIKTYAEHFNLYDVIRFNTTVTSLSKSDGRWILRCSHIGEGGAKEIIYNCKFVAVATGHHAKPKIPTFKGEENFTGEIIHSVNYKSPLHNNTDGKRLLVIGIGNSAVDVAVDNAAARKEKIFLSTRSGAWVLNNYVFDQPIDHYACRFFLKLPWQIGTLVLETVAKLTFGNPFRWNINPKMRALQTQPTVSPTMYYHLRRGNLEVKGNVKSFTNTGVIFENGEKLNVDVVIKCTGYYIDLPFIEDSLKCLFFDESNNTIKLYKNVFSSKLGPSIGFIGFVQPASGGILSMSETQARWMAEICKGRCSLPAGWEMEDDIQNHIAEHRRRYFTSSRHTIQEDPVLYNDDVASLFGAKPTIWKHPLLAWSLLFGTCGCAQYRLEGPGMWPKAYEVVKNIKVTPLMNYFGIFLVLVVILFISFIISLFM